MAKEKKTIIFIVEGLSDKTALENIFKKIYRRNKEIDLKKLLEKTKYKEDGMGGLICNGLMYVGYPR